MFKIDLTHRQLCELGAKHLVRGTHSWKLKSTYALVEIVTGCSESPDIFGVRGADNVMVEVKTSRKDFKSDYKKPHRNGTRPGIGAYRYYLCPTLLIRKDEVPEKWGLLYCDPKGKITLVKGAEYFEDRNFRGELVILKSVIRREIGVNKVLDYRK